MQAVSRLTFSIVYVMRVRTTRCGAQSEGSPVLLAVWVLKVDGHEIGVMGQLILSHCCTLRRAVCVGA